MGPSAVLAREESKRRKQALAEQENNSASNLDRVDGQVLCDVDDKSYNDTVCDNAVNADEATDIDDKTNKKERNAEKTRNKMTTMSKKLSVRSDKFSKTSLEKDWR